MAYNNNDIHQRKTHTIPALITPIKNPRAIAQRRAWWYLLGLIVAIVVAPSVTVVVIVVV